jgi:hypothetical protein
VLRQFGTLASEVSRRVAFDDEEFGLVSISATQVPVRLKEILGRTDQLRCTLNTLISNSRKR